MPIPASINDLSTTASSNGPAGSETPTDGDGYLRAHAGFIAELRDKTNGTDTLTIRSGTFSGTMTGAATWSGLQTFAGGISGSGVATVVSAVKSATTERTSTTSVSDDPHLTVALTVGVWILDGLLRIAESAAGNDCGLKGAFVCSGTATGCWAANGNSGGAAIQLQQAAIGSTATITNATMNPVSSPTDWARVSGYVDVTVAGNLKFQWAQLTSDPNGANVLIGSWMSCTKIS